MRYIAILVVIPMLLHPLDLLGQISPVALVTEDEINEIPLSRVDLSALPEESLAPAMDIVEFGVSPDESTDAYTMWVQLADPPMDGHLYHGSFVIWDLAYLPDAGEGVVPGPYQRMQYTWEWCPAGVRDKGLHVLQDNAWQELTGSSHVFDGTELPNGNQLIWASIPMSELGYPGALDHLRVGTYVTDQTIVDAVGLVGDPLRPDVSLNNRIGDLFSLDVTVAEDSEIGLGLPLDLEFTLTNEGDYPQSNVTFTIKWNSEHFLMTRTPGDDCPTADSKTTDGDEESYIWCDRNTLPPGVAITAKGKFFPYMTSQTFSTFGSTDGTSGLRIWATVIADTIDFHEKWIKVVEVTEPEDLFLYALLNVQKSWGDGSDKRNTDVYDLYLEDERIVDDLSVGERTGLIGVQVESMGPDLYVVDGDAPDRSTPLDTVEVDLVRKRGDEYERSENTLLVLSVDESGAFEAQSVPHVPVAAEDPGKIGILPVHLAPGLGPVDIQDTSDPPVQLANSVAYGESGLDISLEPGTRSFRVTPENPSISQEVFRLNLDSAGEAYILSLEWTGEEQSQSMVLNAYDSEGGIVTSEITTDAESADVPSAWLSLFESYPNPFSTVTEIRYRLQTVSLVQIDIFDLTGRLVRRLMHQNEPPGTHTAIWNGRNASGTLVPSGMYLVRLTSDDDILTRRVVLAR